MKYEQDESPSIDLAQQDLVSQHRVLLEKQLADRAKMLRTTMDIGYRMYRNMIERSKAILWAQSLATNMKENRQDKFDDASPECNMQVEPRIVVQGNINQTSGCISVQYHTAIRMRLDLKRKPRMSKVLKAPFDE